MTETLQDKIDAIWSIEKSHGQMFGVEYEINKAIQELREDIEFEIAFLSKSRIKTNSAEGSIRAYRYVLTLIGEKK